jgi:hypothetical protein
MLVMKILDAVVYNETLGTSRLYLNINECLKK